jgi:alcohol dehydrogenase, propanol-preferring
VRAMVLRGQAPIERRPLRLEDVSDPTPGPDELLVRVRACGICRTDLHVVEGDLPPVRLPLVPGHQVVGIVESAPSDARARVGDRVGIAWLRWTCGRCQYCTSGRENLCERAAFTGWHADGGFAEHAVVPAAFAYAIPAAFSDVDAAPLLCAGIIGFRALERAAVPPGGRLGLWGFGSSAHVTLQIARGRGARVHVLTREPTHRELARALGATWVGDVHDVPPEPLDSAIVFAPVGELVPVALQRLARGGTLALAGIYMTPTPSLDYARDLFYERQVRTVTANTRADGAALLAEAARVPVRLATTTFPLADANDALVALKRGAFAGSGVLVS